MGFWENAEAAYTQLRELGQEIPFHQEMIHDFYQSFVEGSRYLLYIDGIFVTIKLTIFALLLGTVLGIVIAVIRTAHDQQRQNKNPILGILNAICKLYTTVIRGTPAMVQLLIAYFAIFAGSRNTFGIAVLVFGVNSGAYVAEIIRGGIMSVDRGQMEAGRSLGMKYAPVMRHIIIPQAIKNILPALGNELITLLKETSIVTVIGLVDLTKVAMQIQSKTYQGMFPLCGVALVYLVMVMLLTWGQGKLERRLAASDRR